MQSHAEKIEKLLSMPRAFSAREATAYGIPHAILSYNCKRGKITRVGRGLYASTRLQPTSYPDLAQLAAKQTDFVVCLLSALRIHEFTTQLPTSLWIAVRQGARMPSIAPWPLSCIHLNKTPYEYGIEEHEIDGLKIKVYSAAKTVADCFKFRNKIGLDVALEALREGVRLKLFTIAELDAAAEVCRVSNVMRPYMETILS